MPDTDSTYVYPFETKSVVPILRGEENALDVGPSTFEVFVWKVKPAHGSTPCVPNVELEGIPT